VHVPHAVDYQRALPIPSGSDNPDEFLPSKISDEALTQSLKGVAFRIQTTDFGLLPNEVTE